MKPVLLITLAVVLAACGGPKTGPEPVHYDRDICEQCRMIISEPRFATEVRDGGGVLHRFDDPGGAILWMDAHHIDPQTSAIWVMDMGDGKTWLDAHTAWFVPAATPMDHGYGAVAQQRPGALRLADFARAVRARARQGRAP